MDLVSLSFSLDGFYAESAEILLYDEVPTDDCFAMLFFSCENLTSLDLSGLRDISDEMIEAIGTYSRCLRRLVIGGHTDMDGSGLTHLCNSTRWLEELVLGEPCLNICRLKLSGPCPIRELDFSGLINLTGINVSLPLLTTIRLPDSLYLSDTSLNCPELLYLHLLSCKVLDSDLLALCPYLPKLRCLELRTSLYDESGLRKMDTLKKCCDVLPNLHTLFFCMGSCEAFKMEILQITHPSLQCLEIVSNCIRQVDIDCPSLETLRVTVPHRTSVKGKYPMLRSISKRSAGYIVSN
mmetsp:Transcript_2631/g.4050  ORF Transcript_2631/g.4050 Transcript_2631/m.4050 type:complete len:295 (+) Transcript_2631:221-1105(+)